MFSEWDAVKIKPFQFWSTLRLFEYTSGVNTLYQQIYGQYFEQMLYCTVDQANNNKLLVSHLGEIMKPMWMGSYYYYYLEY